VAAQQLGRRYIGIELDAAHSATARQRLATKGFMADLETWSEVNVIDPLRLASNSKPKEWDQTVADVKAAIRARVLESYRNGRGNDRPTGINSAAK
jgi:predicted O-methyltransferase YrrM